MVGSWKNIKAARYVGSGGRRTGLPEILASQLASQGLSRTSTARASGPRQSASHVASLPTNIATIALPTQLASKLGESSAMSQYTRSSYNTVDTELSQVTITTRLRTRRTEAAVEAAAGDSSLATVVRRVQVDGRYGGCNVRIQNAYLLVPQDFSQDSLRPVTIKQILDAQSTGDDFKIDGSPISQVGRLFRITSPNSLLI